MDAYVSSMETVLSDYDVPVFTSLEVCAKQPTRSVGHLHSAGAVVREAPIVAFTCGTRCTSIGTGVRFRQRMAIVATGMPFVLIVDVSSVPHSCMATAGAAPLHVVRLYTWVDHGKDSLVEARKSGVRADAILAGQKPYKGNRSSKGAVVLYGR